ncbi:hypothetical protein P175DRAFT_0481764 [Aspergillus ochraceoroseus IBT 24754]|uniref:CorA family metal ion transporter n=3 Tax=Aspergillus subgen. Nidulantes TaxID=2720870 RepID=A0A0F8XS09_9EURO|nr:uncharacterized protein P175DRAFT_0481764 [Aspergillus ochraceoroseus IBT 24754]KKK15670.1 hypothetical protein AOCH_006535 [Aspergillus ochraceoroseus]KKK26297.1 hypothetical protein ARAM_001585 [Aspergillus rambellii]PTU20405.1 hypothetical protein P175DRAFT_0481764 [Aspergillus ochraceoroseus IBT 24754]
MSTFKLPFMVPFTRTFRGKGEDKGTNGKEYGHSEPTQLSFFSSHLDSCLHASSLESLEAIYEPIRTLLDHGRHNELWWLDITAPSEEDIEILSRRFSLHPLTTEDIKTGETREKIELFGPYYFLSLRPPSPVDTNEGVRTSPLNVYAVVFRDGVLSFSWSSNPHAAHVRSRMKEHQSHFPLTSDWICYALIDDIVDGFGPFITSIDGGVEMIEDSISITRPDDIGLALQRIYQWRKEVMHVRHLLNDKTDVIRCFARHCDAPGASSSQMSLYLSDIQDHVLTMMGKLDASEQMLSRSQSKFLSQLSFDSSRMRNQIMLTLSRLTLVPCIVVPLQFITGLFGMNTHVPGQGADGLAWWFSILGVVLTLVVLFYNIAKRLGVI